MSDSIFDLVYTKTIFNKVSEHLLKQNAKSTNKKLCLYRDGNGMKCAIGCLISDEFYTPELEGKCLLWDGDKTAVFRALEKSGIYTDKLPISLLSALQQIHDTESPSDWPDSLTYLKCRYNLT